MQDLEGLTVISVEHAVAAPFASRKLADAGARVIKVERPEGDFARGYDSLVAGQSSYFVWLNAGKESIALDLKTPADKAVLRRMIAAADIVVQNLGPGVMERLGFGPDALCAEFPALICCSISGYGRSGPRARQKAYDLLIQAESGLSGITGTPEGPARVGASVVDITAGMTAYSAILEALIGRGITGRGRHVEVSMYQAMAEWLNVPYLQHRYGGRTPAREGLRHPTIAPYGLFVCGDGQELLIAIQNDREWAALMQVFGAPDYAQADGFASNDARVANRPAVDALVQDLLGRQGREATVERLDSVRIAYGRLSSMQDLVDHPQSRFATVPLQDGPVAMLAPGATVAGEAGADHGPVPALDQHGAALRREFG